jgi:hypothetical protein
MDNFFEIPLTFQSEEFIFPAELIPFGYSYKIEVDVFGKIISFEPDEERNFRGLISPDDFNDTDHVDKALLQAIANQLVVLFKD